VPISRLCAVSRSIPDLDMTDPVAEAGLLALRERRMRVTKVVSLPANNHLTSMANMQDFTSAKEKVLYRKDENTPAGLYL